MPAKFHMTTNNENDLVSSLDAFLSGLDKHDEKEKLFLLSGLLELLRHTKSQTDVMYMAELLASLPYADWPRIPFSITKTLLSDSYQQFVRQLGVPDRLIMSVLRSGLLLFLDEMSSDYTVPPTEQMLKNNIKIVAESVLPAQPLREKPANPKLPVVATELFNARLVRRVFEPVKFTPELAAELRLQVVTYRAPLTDGRMGPVVRGLAAQVNSHFQVFLETGEVLDVPVDYEHIKVSTAPEDFKNLSPAALLVVAAIVSELETFSVLDVDQMAAVRDGKLGRICATHFRGVTDVDDLLPLEHVFDIGRAAARIGATGATGPTGAIVRFPIPAAGNKAVVIEAHQDAFGPYSNARLVETAADGKETVLMRHETPRHYSLRGVYLFPLQDCLVSLTAIF